MEINKLNYNSNLEDFNKFSKLEKEHQKNLNLINKQRFLLFQKLEEFFKDNPIQNCYQISNQPNIFYVYIKDNRRFVVEFSLSFDGKSVKSNVDIKELN